jgi:hypothetical protein
LCDKKRYMSKLRQTPSKTRKTLKPKPNTDAREGNIYDKIIKENLEKALKTIIQDVGGVHFVKSQPLPTKMQHTKERDPDELSLIWFADGSQKILHAEAHLKDEDDVNLRVGDYHIMLKRSKHKKSLSFIMSFILAATTLNTSKASGNLNV